MPPLEKTLRNQLEIAVREARDVAELAARVALEQLGVGEASPFNHLSESERELRRRLRAHGRQLGDTLNGGKDQTIERLVEEVAYEHWHRMLFARFLEVNDLLMYPDPANPVPVSLEECEDLAAKEGAKNGWELASRFAAQMLPQIFRPDSPVFQLTLPPEHQKKLERLVGELPSEVFTASDSLGWVYQFWQSKRKDEVNASEVKIGARELPAVTQLFTEPYMVSFLLDNSLGAWWAAHSLTRKDFAAIKSEEELRKKASLLGVPLKYLRFVKDVDGLWTPSAGTFDGWPENLKEFKILDPCCGSGHFLVAAFLMLVPMRMELEGLSAREAVDAVLRDNLHGLEIDRRCVELAVFALALSAWRYPGSKGYRQLPKLNLACSGFAITTKKEDWLTLAGDNPSLQYALMELYQQFKDAPTLGSLINPKGDPAKASLFRIKWEKIGPLLIRGLSGERDNERNEMGVVAQGLAEAATLLTRKYHLVITNVPYLGRGKQDKVIKGFCQRVHPLAKADLATCFVERCLAFCTLNGASAIVAPQNWWFTFSYRGFRRKILQRYPLHFAATLGEEAWQSFGNRGPLAGLVIFGVRTVTDKHFFSGIDALPKATISEKKETLSNGRVFRLFQSELIKNPDCIIAIKEPNYESLLSSYATSSQGIKTGDNGRFCRYFWELMVIDARWRFCQSSVSSTRPIGGMEKLSFWGDKGAELARRQGINAWGKHGVLVCLMRSLPVTQYFGNVFLSSVSPVIVNDKKNIPAIWAFCSSQVFASEVRKIDKRVCVTNANILKVPINIEHWTKIANRKYPNGLPKIYSDDPTQWIFHGNPAKSDHPLQVSVARLLGYQWPAELDKNMELSHEARNWAEKSKALLPYADKDGIVCIPPVRGEMNAEHRLEKLLAVAYGDEWSQKKKSELLTKVGYAGKTLESWLRERFFSQHCKLFKHRPFIWHIWDGLHDGFAALVNYHKLDAKLLERLIYTYLGDWIRRQKEDKRLGLDGAEEKLAAAQALKKRLELILEGEEPYDIFVRWKPIEKQPIGWNPDLNDGVRLNIRPFMSVPDVGKKGTGVLRDKPNIKWNKDRGKDIESAPWHPLFKGERINDYHMSLKKKLKAREKKNEQISR